MNFKMKCEVWTYQLLPYCGCVLSAVSVINAEPNIIMILLGCRTVPVKQWGFIWNDLQVPVQQQMVQGPMQSPLQQQQPLPEATDEVAHQEHFQDLKVTSSS
jgi:hypothetical protein